MPDSTDESDCEIVSSQPGPPKMYDTVPESIEYKFQFHHKTSDSTTKMRLKYVLKEGNALPYTSTITSRKGKEFQLTFSKTLAPSVEGYSGIFENDWHIFKKDIEENTSFEDRESQLSSPSPTRMETSADQSPSQPSADDDHVDDPSESELSTSSTTVGSSVHQKPNWLPQLLANFYEEIISVCSSRTQEAVRKNEHIESDKEFKRVRNEILNSVVTKLQEIFGQASRPVRSHMREIIAQLGLEYPDMFRSREATSEKRGVDKMDFQAQKLSDRYREKLRRDSPYAQPDRSDDPEAPAAKKAKMREVYGVSKEKWHKKKKASPVTLAEINKLKDEKDFVKREAVFEKHREELCNEFREGRRNINQICKPFFSDARHLGLHFKFITETPPLNVVIEENFKKFTGYLEIFILDADKSIETRKSMDDIELVCSVQYAGSTIMKDIHLLRLACEHFDGSGDGKTPLIRMASDSDEVDSDGSPHLLAVLVENTIIFELWVEQSKLLGNLSLVQGLAAFFHLCFCFDLKYPKGGQTVADLLQRQVCKYGDDSGTRTWKRKDSAEKKVEHFRAQICKLIL